MNIFRQYKCDTCNKETSQNSDNIHAFIDKCNITFGCSGRLRFVKEHTRNERNIHIENILQSEYILGDSPIPEIPKYIDAASSETNNLVIAIVNKPSFNDFSEATIIFSEILNKEQEFREYTFNAQVPVNAISGKDSSSEQKVLNFDESDDITILINGETVDPSSYLAIENSIRFKKPITYNSYSSTSVYIKILVFAKAVSIEKSLTFLKNNNGQKLSAWSNVKEIKIGENEFALFTCQDISSIDLNSRLTVKEVKVDNEIIDNTFNILLLAEQPFGPLDRIVTKAILLNTLDSGSNHLMLSVVSKEVKVLVTSSSIADVYPVINLIKIFNVANELDSENKVADETSLNKSLTQNNQYILGPI